jgi:hypothetical protein
MNNSLRFILTLEFNTPWTTDSKNADCVMRNILEALREQKTNRCLASGATSSWTTHVSIENVDYNRTLGAGDNTYWNGEWE